MYRNKIVQIKYFIYSKLADITLMVLMILSILFALAIDFITCSYVTRISVLLSVLMSITILVSSIVGMIYALGTVSSVMIKALDKMRNADIQN